jgi:hypothetical protein
MDLSIQCNPVFLRPTVSKIVSSQAAANNTRIPLGIVCKPMAGDIGTENDGRAPLPFLLSERTYQVSPYLLVRLFVCLF